MWIGQSYQIRVTDWCHLLSVVQEFQIMLLTMHLRLPMAPIACTIRWHWFLGANAILIVAQALVVIDHLSNVRNFQLTWFIRLEVPNWLGLSIPSDIREERNMSFLLRHTELVLVQTDCSQTNYLLTLDDQKVLSLWRTCGGKLPTNI